MNLLYFYLLFLLHPYISFWGQLFEAAGRKKWEALVPGYNYFVAFKITCEKPWWSLLMIIPGVHLCMWSVVNTSLIRRFGYYSLMDTVQGIFFPYLLFYKIFSTKQEVKSQTNWANSKETEDRKWGDHLILFMTLPIIGHALAFLFSLQILKRDKPGKKSHVKEWGDSLMFALIAASIIRTYVFEPFQIPTGSMEKSLLVGDFLFVNKTAFGAKVPVTPLSFPLVHNTVPWLNIRSYSTLETCDYWRMPGYADIQRNDVVVFNFPAGDTAIYDPRVPDGLMGHNYHDILNSEAQRILLKEKYNNQANDSVTYKQFAEEFIRDIEIWKAKARKMLAEKKIATDMSTGRTIKHFGLIYRPVDKRENYVKRCVGLPGDWMEIKQSVLYVNDKPAYIPENQNIRFSVTNFTEPNYKVMMEKYGLERSRNDFYLDANRNCYIMELTSTQLNLLKKDYPDARFTKELQPQYADNLYYKPSAIDWLNNIHYFPNDFYINNTPTDFTRFQIPSKGQTVNITKANIAWYRRIISAYEGHTLQEKSDGIYIDGKKTSTYTFAMNYYWMMGDNRYNSADSRFWGFVPEDHIVGRASLVWFSKSIDPSIGIRWERIFKWIE
jgi:signal peptidase I